MKGDFSQWRRNPLKNINGVLQQQGRVFLDSDWNDDTHIAKSWEVAAGRDLIGNGVAAVPAQEPDGFKVESALVNSENQVELTVHPGRSWVNGYLVYFEEINENKRRATFLKEPADTSSGLAGIRDAVVLEIWREELNAFQLEDFPYKERLLEPALGGPDTTERIYTSSAFRLLRLNKDERCPDVRQRLTGEGSLPGSLSVTLKPMETGEGDCPTQEGGGYIGFEHNLYRIEVAQVNQDIQGGVFKWSQYNGGLVGRGLFETNGDSTTITINANMAAITSTRLKSFYLEVVAFEEALGHFRVTYGVEVTLDGNVLTVQNDKQWYTPAPRPSGAVFFRLWNGIERMNRFAAPSGPDEPAHFRDGIYLAFHSTSKADYNPQDFWTFAVRSFEPSMPEVLIDNEPPHGVVYQRVPLAVLNWNAAKNVTYDRGEIDDCRRIFRPLIDQKVCCSFFVGDGVRSQGDFNSLAEALSHIPEEGGQICLLPGMHTANVLIKNRRKIRITGCGGQTVINPERRRAERPIITIINSSSITIDHLTMVNRYGGVIEASVVKADGTEALNDIKIRENKIAAYKTAVCIEKAAGVCIEKNHITLYNLPAGGQGIYAQGKDLLIGENRIISVLSPSDTRPSDSPAAPAEDPGGYFEFCRDAKKESYGSMEYRIMLRYMFSFLYTEGFAPGTGVFQAAGGIQIGSSSECVCIKDNLIYGGNGDGITFGNLPDRESTAAREVKAYIIDSMTAARKEEYEKSFEGFIYDIFIEGNDIRYMGCNGIGPAAYFNIKKVNYYFRLNGCVIKNNVIRYCALQVPKLTDRGLAASRYFAFGGISLFYAEDIIISENLIENNGRSHLQPVCGIFIYYSENADISSNRIVNNGPRTSTDDQAALTGWRGGIVLPVNKKNYKNKTTAAADEIRSEAAAAEIESTRGVKKMIINHNMSSINEGSFTEAEGSMDLDLPLADGIPAVKLHDNIVVQPLGQALLLECMGPVSVLSNHFTSQGLAQGMAASLTRGAAVTISNHGVARDLSGAAAGGSVRRIVKMMGGGSLTSTGEDAVSDTGNMGLMTNTGLDTATLGQVAYLPSGTVLFNDNRVTLSVPAGTLKSIRTGLASGLRVSRSSYASIMIDSKRDDIAFINNQAECMTLNPILGMNVLLAGLSVRAMNNRLQDGIVGIVNSLVVQARLLTIMGNQATHCIVPNSVPAIMTGRWHIYANSVISPGGYCKLSNDEFMDSVQMAEDNITQAVLQLLG